MKRAIAVLALSLLLTGVTSGQEKNDSPKPVVIIPMEIISPVVANQPDCLVRIEDIKLLQFVKQGGCSQFFKVRNTSTKAIRSYTIGAWNSAGTGWEVERSFPANLFPGDVAIPETNEVEVVPLTKELRRQLNLEGDMRALVVLVVVRVEFADGSAYDGESFYKALKAYLNKMSL